MTRSEGAWQPMSGVTMLPTWDTNERMPTSIRAVRYEENESGERRILDEATYYRDSRGDTNDS